MTYKAVKNLVFQGGRVKGLAYVGALKVLDEFGVPEDMKNVVSTSASATTSYIPTLNDISAEFAKIILRLNFKSLIPDFRKGYKIELLLSNL